MMRGMFSAISGLKQHQVMLDVTANDIANVNTAGFKASQTVFQDTLSQLIQGAGAPQGAAGGTNPAQVGLGVRVGGIFTNFGQGSAQMTGRSTDLIWVRCQVPAVSRIQSADERITMPRPQYDQNCRAVRNRCGVTTMGSKRAARIAPMPGHVARILLAGCSRASATSSFSARLRTSSTTSYSAYKVATAARVPSCSFSRCALRPSGP